MYCNAIRIRFALDLPLVVFFGVDSQSLPLPEAGVFAHVARSALHDLVRTTAEDVVMFVELAVFPTRRQRADLSALIRDASRLDG